MTTLPYKGHVPLWLPFNRRLASVVVAANSVAQGQPFVALQEIFDEGLLSGKSLAPGFVAPEPEGMDHHMYSMYIERSLPEETPGMFGMPANAEVGYLTNAAEEIFAAFLR